jgi:leucyl-tRNA synthetase
LSEQDGVFLHDGEPVNRELGKMGKSLRNAVTPDDISRDYGADTLRLYEMATGARSTRRDRGTPPTSSACTGSCNASGAM